MTQEQFERIKEAYGLESQQPEMQDLVWDLAGAMAHATDRVASMTITFRALHGFTISLGAYAVHGTNLGNILHELVSMLEANPLQGGGQL
jgi:hypothetical protein